MSYTKISLDINIYCDIYKMLLAIQEVLFWGAIDTFVEIAVAGSIYFFVESKQYKLVIEDFSSSTGTFGLTLLQSIINGFFIFAFLNI